MESKTIIDKIRKAKAIKKINKNGLPSPKDVECSVCEKNFFIKFVISQGDYSKKTV